MSEDQDINESSSEEQGRSNVELSPLSKSKKSKYVAHDKRGRTMKLRRGITIDSGAGSSVMPIRDNEQKAIRESAGSRAGVNYVPAGGEDTKRGRVRLRVRDHGRQCGDLDISSGRNNKALGAILQLVDLGYKVIFNKNLENRKDLSYMMHKATNVTFRFRRGRNVWVFGSYVSVSTDGSNSREQNFHRQGCVQQVR